MRSKTTQVRRESSTSSSPVSVCVCVPVVSPCDVLLMLTELNPSSAPWTAPLMDAY